MTSPFPRSPPSFLLSLEEMPFQEALLPTLCFRIPQRGVLSCPSSPCIPSEMLTHARSFDWDTSDSHRLPWSTTPFLAPHLCIQTLDSKQVPKQACDVYKPPHLVFLTHFFFFEPEICVPFSLFSSSFLILMSNSSSLYCLWSSRPGASEENPTRNHEVAGLMPCSVG